MSIYEDNKIKNILKAIYKIYVTEIFNPFVNY